ARGDDGDCRGRGRRAGRLAARPAGAGPRDRLDPPLTSRARPGGGGCGVRASRGHRGGPGRRPAGERVARPRARGRARDSLRHGCHDRPVGAASLAARRRQSRARMGLLDRVRCRLRGARRPGVPQCDSAAARTRGGAPRARSLHAVRRGHRVRDRPVAVRGVRARGRLDRERLAATPADANRARRMGPPDLRRLLDHRGRAAHAAHGLDPRRRAGAGRAPNRRPLGRRALRSGGAQAARCAAAQRAGDGGPGRNGAGAPRAGGERDRAVIGGRGARAAYFPAPPRAPGRARGERRATARGNHPDRGGDPGGHVARPARPDREGSGRGPSPSRRPGRAVRGGARGGRDDGPRRGGHAPQRAARSGGARVGEARAQAPEEALKAGRLVAATAAALAAIVLLPAVAHAWTPGTHVYLGESVLANLHQLPTAVADLLRAFPFDYLYGNIAADTSLAKKYAPVGRHCHAWHVGQEIFDLAPTDPLRSFGLGYLSHLAADTVAHNFFVPRQLVLTSSTAALGHSYWESRFETHLGDAYAKEAKELILQDHTPSDTHLDTIISPTL